MVSSSLQYALKLYACRHDNGTVHVALGHERHFRTTPAISPMPATADVGVATRDRRSVPCVDGSELARENFTSHAGRCGHVFGLSVRFIRPLAIMPSTDQVPVKSTRSNMRWHLWVVLIAGSTGSALRVVCPANLHITPGSARSRLRCKCDGLSVALTPGHHRPCHSGRSCWRARRQRPSWTAVPTMR